MALVSEGVIDLDSPLAARNYSLNNTGNQMVPYAQAAVRDAESRVCGSKSSTRGSHGPSKKVKKISPCNLLLQGMINIYFVKLLFLDQSWAIILFLFRWSKFG